MPVFDAALLGQIVNIVVIDLVLSGDNAVVIGMAASRLAGRDRRQAILWGVIGAIGLRVLFTALIALLLGIPLLQIGGGLMLVWIGFKLVRPANTQAHADVRAALSRVDAIRTIVLADVVMSLDNILAVGGAAHGSVVLLLFGLALSMPLITFGSGFVAWALDRAPALIFLGAAILAKVAGEMIGNDPFVERALAGAIGDGGVHTKVAALSWLAWLPGANALPIRVVVLEGGITFAVVAAGLVMRARARRAETLAEQARLGATGALSVHHEVTEAVHEIVEDVGETTREAVEAVDEAAQQVVHSAAAGIAGDGDEGNEGRDRPDLRD